VGSSDSEGNRIRKSKKTLALKTIAALAPSPYQIFIKVIVCGGKPGWLDSLSPRIFSFKCCRFEGVKLYGFSTQTHPTDTLSFKKDFEKLLSKYGIKSKGYFINVTSVNQSGGQTALVITNNYYGDSVLDATNILFTISNKGTQKILTVSNILDLIGGLFYHYKTKLWLFCPYHSCV
jgi:hypothetical protein